MAVSTPASTRLATALGSTLCKPPHGQSLPDRGFPHACHLSRRKSKWIPVHSFGRRGEEAAGEVAGPQSVDGVSLHCRGTWPRSFPRGIENGTRWPTAGTERNWVANVARAATTRHRE